MRVSHRRLVPLALALVAVLAATLFPTSAGAPTYRTACIICADGVVADGIVNVILFLPLGAGLAALGWPAWRCILVGAAVSAGIEYGQLFVPGRDSSLADFVSNTAGTAVGLALVRTAAFWLVPPPRRAALLALGAASAAATTWLISGALLSPSFPTGPYAGERTLNVGGLEWYRERVLDAMLGDLPIAARELPNSGGIRDRLLADSGISLRVRVVAGSPPTSLGSMLRIVDAEGREVLLLGPDQQDMVFRVRSRGADFRLEQPDLRLVNGLQNVSPGDTLIITLRGRRGRYCVAVNGSHACDLGFRAAGAWALLYYPAHLPPWVKTLLNLAWMGGLLFPLGYWSPSWGVRAVAAGVAAGGLLVTPLVVPVLPSTAAEWIAAGLGFLLGTLAQRSALLRLHTQGSVVR